MFIGRERELNSLEELYSQPGFGMTVIGECRFKNEKIDKNI